jgi:NAD+ kinase
MAPSQLGLVVHPSRRLDDALSAIGDWASSHGVRVGQVSIAGQSRRVAPPIDVASCDVVLALGGDGTTLSALHAAAPAGLAVLGVACGSIGVLTSVAAERVTAALESVAAGDWTRRQLPGLEIASETGDVRVAINDFAVIRDGAGQVITGISVDDELYARTAGDGVLVATALGSSGYTMAAGGPILAPGARGMVVTPLAHHGGVAPPLVVGPDSRVTLSVEPGYGGSRFEVDGQEAALPVATLSLSLRDEYATLITLADQEPRFAGLRRRALIVDAPRVQLRDARTTTHEAPPG